MSNVKYTFKCNRNCCGLPCRISIVESEKYLSLHKNEIKNRLENMCLLGGNPSIDGWKFERKDSYRG